MTYRKAYPSPSQLKFVPKENLLCVRASCETKYNPDLWGIKYLFDKGLHGKGAEICVNGTISKTLALRMFFLRYLFPDIKFHDDYGDKFSVEAEEIIRNIGTKYVTYSVNGHLFDDRGTKDKLESCIEKELADNISRYIPDFADGVKIIRQFPANMFRDCISESSRVTDKLWIDMVSVNCAGELSPVELKVGGNIPLDLFAQGLDYGIYCHLFKGHVKDNWFNEKTGAKKDKVTIYYIGEEFHPALVGRGDEKGIISLIRRNELFNIVFVKITVDKKRRCIVGKSEVIFDTRKQCGL